MKIILISDTHSYHRKINIPEGDLLIHCGDISFRGEPHIMEDFSNWMKDLPIENKIVIAGNHEVGMSSGPKRLDMIETITDSGAYYLENSGVEINGYKIWGSPNTPTFYDWEFNVPRGKQIAKIWEKIPCDTQILITHGQPYGILDPVEDTASNFGRDLHQGCEDLALRIKELKDLKLYAGGHLHLQGGQSKVVDNVIFVNAAICTENYNPVNKPIVIDLEDKI